MPALAAGIFLPLLKNRNPRSSGGFCFSRSIEQPVRPEAVSGQAASHSSAFAHCRAYSG
jgi:hypothetical protein